MVRSTDASVAGPVLLFFGRCGDHGVEAVIGRSESDWARDNSTVTNSLLLPLFG
jgi:hypothetical protein